MKPLGVYKNGNYKVAIFDDGTKIRRTEEDEFIADFPESMDVKITNYCDMNCPMCHEKSTTEGGHGDVLGAKFIDTLSPYTEIAIGGGNPLSHPDLIPFLIKLRDRKIIASMTINQKHFMENLSLIENLISNNLIKGLGISLTNINDNFTHYLSKFPNIVLHVINGMVNMEDLRKLYNKGLKILILGYKTYGRGINNYENYNSTIEILKQDMYNNLQEIISHFKVVSFDNLAIEQLNPKRLMSEHEWDEFYMGDDGMFTMYIDLVNKQYAKSSISPKRYELANDIKTMFKTIRDENVTIK